MERWRIWRSEEMETCAVRDTRYFLGIVVDQDIVKRRSIK
jgi:hypothetical protein